MNVSLDIRTGLLPGNVVSIQPGQTFQVGRSSDADYSIPDDQKLSRIHFAVSCKTDQCIVRDLDSRNGILVNNTTVSEAVLQDGDVILAGGTTFTVRFSQEEPELSSPSLSMKPASKETPRFSVFQSHTTAYTQAAIHVSAEPPPWESGIQDPDPLVRKEALFAAAWMRQPWLLDHCRKAASTPSLEQWTEHYLLAILAQSEDDIEAILTICQAPELGAQRYALLGALGHPQVMEFIFHGLQSGDPQTAVAAGQAFLKLTGVDIESDTRVTLPPEDGTEPDEFEQEFLDEVTLPSLPLAEKHWEEVKEKFSQGTRWCRGFDLNQSITEEVLAEIDLESRWETCLRGKYYGNWSGSLIDLEIFPQKPLASFN